MLLDEEESAMLAGEQGPVRQWAMRHQCSVGAFFDAKDLVRVGQAHIMGDPEAMKYWGRTYEPGWEVTV